MMLEIAHNIQAVQAKIQIACEKVGRSLDEVLLVAVSKTMPAELVRAAAEAGLTHFGENRIEEALSKKNVLAELPLSWHMIGHIQSRKAEDVAQGGFTLVHSLDSLKLADRYSRFALEQGGEVPVLLEVNVSGESTKSGWELFGWENDDARRATLWQDIEHMLELPGLRIEGLMTMAPYYNEAEEARPVFRSLVGLREALRDDFPQIPWQHLSMGMTNDYDVAIEEGATIVRVGRAIFGERNYGEY
jgi:PLP dependent protein